MKLAALRSLTWEGRGGHHWMGTIHHPDGNHELIRKLSRKEAKSLSAIEDSHFWSKTTERFETEEDLVRAALKWCEDNLGDIWLLLEFDTHNPNHVVGGKGYSKQHLARIEKWQKWWWDQTQEYREKNWNKGYKIWNRLIEPA